MSQLGTHYHVGIIVRDLEGAQRTLTDQLGVRWGPVLRMPQLELRDGAGKDLLLPNTFCYSVDQPCLELIEEVPGSVWVANEYSNLHHIGFWSDDLPGTSAELAGLGCPLQLCGRRGDVVPSQFAYHGNALGIRIEVVDASMREMMQFLFQPAG